MEPDQPTPPPQPWPYDQPAEPGPQDQAAMPPHPEVPALVAAPEPTDKVSVAAFVFSLVGVGIAAVPLGIWGIVRTSRGPRRGRGFAIAALAVSAVWAVVATVALVSLVGGGGLDQLAAAASPAVTTATSPATATVPPTTSGASGTPVEEPGGPLAKPRNVYWQDLRPGMCVLIPEQEDELDDKVVDCRSEHHEEVIHRGKLAGNRTWPGDDAVDTAALARCEQAFAEYVGLPYDSSRLDIDFYTTDQEGWKAGDRTLVCLLFDPEQEFATQSFKGSRQ